MTRKPKIEEDLYELEEVKPCVVYVRVSTDDQKDGFSIPAQIELLMKYAQHNNFRVVRVFEESQSAKESGRKQFGAMLKYLNSHPEVYRILVEKTDRLYRNFQDYVLVDTNKYELHLVKENEVLSKNSTSHQKLVHGLKVLLAKNFIDNLREETQKGRRRKAEEGYVIGKAPYGYKKINKNEAEIVPHEAKFIAKAFELYDSGLSLFKTRKWLLENGWVYRPTGLFISRGHLYALLRNPLYKGYIPFNGEEFKGRHPAIVSPELFDRVQERLKREREHEHEYLFNGVMKCEYCGRQITMELHKEKYVYYHCNNPQCKQKTIFTLEEYFVKQFLRAMKRIKVQNFQYKLFMKKAGEELYKVKFIQADQQEKLVLEQQTLKVNLDKMYEDKLKGVISEEFYVRKQAEFQQRLEEIETELDTSGSTTTGKGEDVLPYLRMIVNIAYYFETGGFHVQKALARLVFERVMLKGKTLRFKYALPFRYFVDNAEDYVTLEPTSSIK